MNEQNRNSGLDSEEVQFFREIGTPPPDESVSVAVRQRMLQRGLAAFMRRFESGDMASSIKDEEEMRQIGIWLEVAGRLGDARTGDPLVSFLLRRLDDGNRRVRAAAVEALASAAVEHADVRAAMMRKLDDTEWWVRHSACRALASAAVEDPDAQTALMRKLDDTEWLVRRAAVQALAPAVVGNADAQTALMERLGDESSSVREVAVQALAPLVADNADVRAALMERLGDTDGGVRKAAVEALAPLVVDNADVRTALMERFGDQNPWVRKAVVKVLASAAAENADVRAAVMRRLDNLEWRVRKAAVEALASLSAEDADVRAALMKRQNDTDEGVRAAAIAALTPWFSLRDRSDLQHFHWRRWSSARRETVLHLLEIMARKEDPATVYLGVLGLAAQGALWEPGFSKVALNNLADAGDVHVGAFTRRGVGLDDENLRPRGRRVLEGSPPAPVRTGSGRSPVPPVRVG